MHWGSHSPFHADVTATKTSLNGLDIDGSSRDWDPKISSNNSMNYLTENVKLALHHLQELTERGKPPNECDR